MRPVTGGLPVARFHAVTVLDLKNPVDPRLLQHGGIDHVFLYCGVPALTDDSRAHWERLFKLYEGAGVKVLLMASLYSSPPEGTEALDVSGRRIKMACLRNEGFYDWMRRQIGDMAREFSNCLLYTSPSPRD